MSPIMYTNLKYSYLIFVFNMCLFLQLIFEEATLCNNQKDRPKSLNLQTSRATLSNIRSNEHGMSRSDLANCVNGLQFASLFYSSEYPAKDGDYHPVTEKLLNHAQGKNKNLYYVLLNYSFIVNWEVV